MSKHAQTKNDAVFTPYVARVWSAGQHSQQRAALVCKPTQATGRYWLVWITSDGVAAVSANGSIMKTAQPVEGYPLKRAVSKFRRAGRSLSISKTAKDLLMEVHNGL